MGKWDGLNRRQFPRVMYPCLVILRHQGEDPEIILSHTENVGIGGLSVIIKKNIPIFSEVSVEIDLLDLAKHIKCDGKVVWSVKREYVNSKKPAFYDLGIEFEDLPVKDKKRLEAAIGDLVEKRENIVSQ